MRLQRECTLDVHGGTEEYRTAIKSVIRCQIQSLLQKLAVETGEESILISTNVSAGTYNHLGSHLGKEYLEDGDEFVQVICEKFTNYCAESQNHDSSTDSISHKSISSTDKPESVQYRSLPAPKRKRLFNTLELPDTPLLKRKPHQYLLDNTSSQTFKQCLQQDYSPGRCDDSSHVEHTTSPPPPRESSQVDKENETPSLSWIKVEPRDEGNPSLSVNGVEKASPASKQLDDSYADDPSQTSIVNRPKSLIPLANIYKKYGTNKHVKIESPTKSSQDDGKQPEKSILRSLYEQPLSQVDDGMYADDIGSTDTGKDSQTPAAASLSLPSTINEEAFTSSSENLVLSGYYDSDSYPTYRHKQKHTANNQLQKKLKAREKVILTDSLPDTASIDAHLRTFESGGRLVYACDVCNRELSHLTSYRRHMKLHTMERPHKCPVCSKGFIRKYHCIDHLNKHHKGVGFDPDSLKLTGINTKEENQDNSDTTTALMTLTPEPGEYNYTLDQSFMDNSDNDLSLNTSHIDQSASAMLSELAKSAAKSAINTLNLSTGTENALEKNSPEDKTSINTSEVLQTEIANCHDNNESEKTGITNQNPSTQSNNMQQVTSNTEDGTSHIKETGSQLGSVSMMLENSAEMRKNEVSDGIKAIVDHLKSSSRNKRKRVPPKSLTMDMIN